MKELKGFKSSLSFDNLKELPVMRYWSLPPSSSKAQKDKLKSMPSSGKYLASLKKDGAFYKFIKDLDGNISFTSRTESKKSDGFVDKTQNFPAIMEVLNRLPNGTCLLGEIYFDDLRKTSKDVIQVSGCLPAKAIERQKTNPVNYYVFDVLALDGILLDAYPAEHRALTILKEVEELLGENPRVSCAEFVTENLEEFIMEAIARGEEGVVLSGKSQPYYFKNAPAWSYIKYKKTLTDDLDLVIMGTYPSNEKYSGIYQQTWMYWKNLKTGELVYGNFYKDGGYTPVSEGYYYGLVGGLILGAYRVGVLTEVARIASLTDDIREIATNNFEKLKNTVVEVSCMEVLPTGGLRHAKIKRYRDDKPAEECLWESIF